MLVWPVLEEQVPGGSEESRPGPFACWLVGWLVCSESVYRETGEYSALYCLKTVSTIFLATGTWL